MALYPRIANLGVSRSLGLPRSMGYRERWHIATSKKVQNLDYWITGSRYLQFWSTILYCIPCFQQCFKTRLKWHKRTSKTLQSFQGHDPRRAHNAPPPSPIPPFEYPGPAPDYYYWIVDYDVGPRSVWYEQMQRDIPPWYEWVRGAQNTISFG